MAYHLNSNPSPEYKKVTFEQNIASKLPGYTTAVPDTNSKIYFVFPNKTKRYMLLPQSFTNATYLINLSEVRPHRVFGITSAAKNHFGSVFDSTNFGSGRSFFPGRLHAFALWNYATPNKMGDPHCSPVLLGHKIINSKTLLYISDGLCTGYNQGEVVKRWSTMDNKWFSSIL